MKFEIKHRRAKAILFSLGTENLKLCVKAAVESRADLGDADLGGADLRGADLGDADLRGADLRDADLRGADLGNADLGGADLRGADLGGAKIHNNIVITKAPIQIIGLTWSITIWDQHMQIGCKFHSHDDWGNFTDEDWVRMGGKDALKMKNTQFPAIIMICNAHRP